MECVFGLPGYVSKVLEDGVWEEGGVKWIFHLFEGSGQEVLKVLELGCHGGGDGLMCWSGVGSSVLGVEEGSAFSSGSFNAVPKFAD